ncbi:hypothetical protein FB639_002968, partial [Coemansia asiatica]
LRKRVSVKIPSAIIKDRSKTRGLYMHVFASQLSSDAVSATAPPDLNDPYLVHATTELVRWNTPFGFAVSSLGFSGSKSSSSNRAIGGNNGGSSKLVAAKSVSWAMSLENHAYTKLNMPRHIAKALAPTSSKVLEQNKRYNPPMFVNSFTQDIPKPVDIAYPMDASNTKIDVDIELRGIKQGWITSKNKLIRIFEPDFIQGPPSRGGNKNNDMGRAILIALSTLLFGFVSRLGVPSLLTIIYCLVFVCVFSYLYIRASALFWLSPSSRWIGYSRVTFAIYFVASIFASINALVSSNGGSSFISVLIVLVVRLYILLILTETPLNPTAWYPCIRKAMQSAKRSTDSDGAYSLVDIADEEEEGASEPASPKPQDAEYVVLVRRDIDSVALWWAARLFLPVLALVVVFCIVSHSLFKSQLGIFAYIMLTFAIVLQWIHWLPQVFINYRTMRGTWIPVTANAYEMAGTLLLLLAISISGYSLSFKTIASEIPNHLLNAALVYQWLFYQFKK